MAACGHDPELF
jgi:hypothetical protein